MKKAAELYQKSKDRLQQMMRGFKNPNLSKEIIQLLTQSIEAGIKENNQSVVNSAKSILFDLLHDGLYGFQPNIKELKNIFKKFKIKYYKLPADFNQINSIFGTIDSTTQDFLQSQKIIRIFFGKGIAEFGTQASTANLIPKLREEGFNGIFEIIFPIADINVISTLYNIPVEQLKSGWFEPSLNARFMTLENFLLLKQDNQIELCELGYSGGMPLFYHEDMIYYPELIEHQIADNKLLNTITSTNTNLADFFHVNTFAKLSPFHGSGNSDAFIKRFQIDTRIWRRGDSHVIILDNSRYQYLTPAANISSLADTKKILEAENKNINNKDAIKALIEVVENPSHHVIFAYAHPFHGVFPCNNFNLKNLITGAKTAQIKLAKQTPTSQSQPMFLVNLFDVDKEALDPLIKLFLTGKSEEYSAMYPDQTFPSLKEFKQLLKQFGKDNIKFIHLNDPQVQEKFAQIKNTDLIVLFTGKLPKNIFDSFYNYHGENNLAAIFEGAGSLTMRINAGKPILHCGGSFGWDFPYEKDPQIIQYHVQLSKQVCPFLNSNKVDENLRMWQPAKLAEQIGNALIQAKVDQSKYGSYFIQLQENANQPEAQRVHASLHLAMVFSTLDPYEMQEILASHYYANAFIGDIKINQDKKINLEVKIYNQLSDSKCLAKSENIIAEQCNLKTSSASRLLFTSFIGSTVNEIASSSQNLYEFGMNMISSGSSTVNEDQTRDGDVIVPQHGTSMDEKILTTYFILSCFKTYSKWKFPGEKLHTLNEEDTHLLLSLQKEVEHLCGDVNQQKESRAAQLPQFREIFVSINNNLNEVTNLINHALKFNQISKNQLNRVEYLIQHLQAVIHEISNHNKTLRKFDRKISQADEKLNDSEYRQATINYDHINHQLSLKIKRF